MQNGGDKKRKMNLPGGGGGGGAGAATGPSGPSSADAARRGLVTVNKLDYELAPDLSVCVSRSNKTHHFSQNAYTPGQRMICILNSGAEYARPDRCYLEFTVKNETNDDMILGQGGATNFLKDLVITSRSGDECERCLDVNRLTAFVAKATSTKEKLNTTGALAGFSSKSTHLIKTQENPWTLLKTATEPIAIDRTTNGASEFVIIKGGQQRKFVIPLSLISGIFKFDKLLPSMFLSGLRVDILLEEAKKAAVLSSKDRAGGTSGDAHNWSIQEPRIVLDSYQLTDSVQRVLNEEAAMRGLELVFRTWHTTQFPLTGTGRTIQMRKAVSRAISILALMYPKEPTVVKNHDYFANMAWDVTEAQLRIGSLYFPQQPIRGSTGESTSRECYYHMLRSASRLSGKSASGITYEQFLGPQVFGAGDEATPMPGTYLPKSTVYNSFTAEQQVTAANIVFRTDDSWAKSHATTGVDLTVPQNGLWFDLERSNVQQLSGIPINNSRVAEINIKVQNPEDRDVYVFLDYVRLLRVFLQNVEIEE
jgi:hypothetical protein